MGYNADQILARFVQFAGKPHGSEPGAKPWTTRQRFPDGSGTSLYYRQDKEGRVVEIDSYGSHFPLGRLVLTPKGKRRRWLLNGDTWPSSGFGRTNDHNATLRQLVQASKDPWFIIPYSAITEAGIELDTITPVDVQEDRYEPVPRQARALEDVPERHRRRQVRRDATGAVITPPDGATADDNGGWYRYERTLLSPAGPLGWSKVTMDGPAYTSPLTWSYEDIEPDADGWYRWTEKRHWLGASLFRARYAVRNRETWTWTRHWAYFVTAFDENEPRPLWFMSQLPHGFTGKTVAEAVAALKPAVVQIAEETGLTVQRQGDVFAIPALLSTRQLHAMGGTDVQPDRLGNRHVLGTNHAATQAIVLPDGDTYARGFLRHRPDRGRQPDHRTIRLGDGKTWHLLARNTVPRSFDGRVDTSSRSWSRGGNVD